MHSPSTAAPEPAAATACAAGRPTSRIVAAIDNGSTEQVDRNVVALSFREAQAWDPFVGLSEDWFSTVGFDWHPHRGFQTLTLVLDGQLEHRDNAGGFGVLDPGDAQWMSAGRAALHYELAHRRLPVHTLQLWLNLPPGLKLMPAAYRDLRAADASLELGPGLQVRTHSGRDVGFPVPFDLVDVQLDTGARYLHRAPGDDAVFAYVVAGSVSIGADAARVGAHAGAWFDAGAPGETAIEIAAAAPSRAVVYSAAPIGAPVVQYGPFVMNSAEEIARAFDDYRNGLFGPIPAGPPG